MERRPSPIEVIWSEGPAAFGFLAESFGFDRPQVVPDGLEFTRSTDRLTIRVWWWSFKNESGFETTIRSAADPATGIVSAGLEHGSVSVRDNRA